VANSCSCFTYSLIIAILNIDISQGSAATCLGCGGGILIRLFFKFPTKSKEKEFWKSVNIWWSYWEEYSVLFFDSQCSINNVIVTNMRILRRLLSVNSTRSGRRKFAAERILRHFWESYNRQELRIRAEDGSIKQRCENRKPTGDWTDKYQLSQMDPRDAQCDEAVNRRKYCQLSELEVPIFWRYHDHLLTQCKKIDWRMPTCQKNHFDPSRLNFSVKWPIPAFLLRIGQKRNNQTATFSVFSTDNYLLACNPPTFRKVGVQKNSLALLANRVLSPTFKIASPPLVHFLSAR